MRPELRLTVWTEPVLFEEYTQLLTHLQKNRFLSCSHEGNVCSWGRHYCQINDGIYTNVLLVEDLPPFPSHATISLLICLHTLVLRQSTIKIALNRPFSIWGKVCIVQMMLLH